MQPFSLRENIIFSYKTYFHLLWRTFFAGGNTQARLTPRRFVTMLFFTTALFTLQTIHWLSFLADEIFFRGYKTIDIRQPLFILGVPRSGTTFLHRLLSRDDKKFTTLTLWEVILAPTITERKIVLGLSKLDGFFGNPMKGLIGWIERSIFANLGDIHKISLSDPEEDYFTLFPIYACFLMILPFPFPEELGHLAFFDDQTPKADKERIMAFYKTCLQRHLYVRGADKTLLSKNVSFSPMIMSLNRAFPDCRIIGTVREPLFAIASHISSMMEGALLFDNNLQDDSFTNQMVDIQQYAYGQLMEVLPMLPVHRQTTVKMEDLQSNLYETVKTIYRRFDYEMTPAFDDYLRSQDQTQKAYKSRHRYDLADYDLSAEDIFNRFAKAYHLFGYMPPLEAAR
jgi:hypothetical protein